MKPRADDAQRPPLRLLVVLIGLVLSMTAGVPAEAQVPGSSRSAKACAICHFRWIETFFVEGRGTELVDYQAEKVVATPDMCISCHDGSIADSRARMVSGKGHKTGVAPPASMKIPDLFPLDEKGRVQCATCHTAHGVPSGEDSETTIFMRTSNRNSAMCRQCHPGREAGGGTGNHPMGTVKEKIPEAMLAASHAKPKGETLVTCESCHTAHGSPYDGYLILSYRDSDLCLACHPSKWAPSKEGPIKKGHVVNVEPQTAVIPASLLERGARLGTGGNLICSTCHNVHGKSPAEHLLVARHDNRSSLCLTCHTDKTSVSATRHNLGRAAPEVANLQGQTVAQGGICSACHLPHKLARNLSGSGDHTTLLCMSCHGPNTFAARPKVSASSHPVGVEPFEKGPDGLPYHASEPDPVHFELPLYDPFGVRKKQGEMTCTTCHDPHRNTPGTAVGGDSEPKSMFLRRSDPDLCRQCHEGKFGIAASKHNLQRTAPDSVNMLDETPAKAGLCRNCHLPHGGLSTFLWSRPLPEAAATDPPTPCLSCHREGGLAASRVLGENDHPVQVKGRLSSTESGMPLFDATGHLSETGKIACYTCHDPHRWDPESTRPATEALPEEGNAGNSFLRLKSTPTPALCGRCHPKKKPVAGTAHDLIQSAPESRNAVDQLPIASGPCGGCHLPHHSKSDVVLWAREISSSAHVVEGLCYSCHAENAPASGKIPAIASHPRQMVFSNTERHRPGQPDYFPLFEPDTGRQVRTGIFTCPSCHDSHQWSLQGRVESGEKTGEGDSSNSFLRNWSYNTICVDCHGVEALYRYQFFHNPNERRRADAPMSASGWSYREVVGVR